MKRFLFLPLAMSMLLSVGIAKSDEASIIVQSTTSTQNSGLFDYILPKFKQQTGIQVNVVAVGTGQALKNGRNGDGDVLLVHAKAAEEEFVAKGYGVERLDVMYNDFVIVGPDTKVSAGKDVLKTLANIAASKLPFLSRGDDSGTNKKELQLWKLAAIDLGKTAGSWYRETGSGMGATLNIAVGMNAYTITDRATWIAFKNKSGLKIISQGDPLLFNQYGVILVNPARHPHVKAKSGARFIKWLTSREGQSTINSYKLNGKQLFFANANQTISPSD